MADLTCTACAAPNPPGSRFCNGCGGALSADQPPTHTEAERRLVTVLFSDVSGYTQMAELIWIPKSYGSSWVSSTREADAIVGRYGGRIDKLMGDAVLAVFGDPVAHEDDAERAVRAALELHAAVDEMRPKFEARVGRSFAMHSGINSGVVITSELDGDRASGPLGDMVNVASRLQSLAAADEILIGSRDTGARAGPLRLRRSR